MAENGLDRFDGSGIKIRRLQIGAPSPIEPCQVCRQEGTS
jgi:hypothetical protein